MRFVSLFFLNQRLTNFYLHLLLGFFTCVIVENTQEHNFFKFKNPREILNLSADQHLNVESNPVALLAGIGDLKDQQSERLLISKMLSSHVVDFLWNTGSEWPGWPTQDNKSTVFNRYCRAGFTSKVKSSIRYVSKLPQVSIAKLPLRFSTKF